MASFSDKGRNPIIPLSLENSRFARLKEFIIDYSTNTMYINTESGLINISQSNNTFNFFKQYLLDHPSIIVDVVIKTTNGEEITIASSFKDIWLEINKIDNKKYKYAGSSTKGGSAISAEKVNNKIIFVIKPNNEKITTFDGSISRTIDLTGLLDKTSTQSSITGDIKIDGKIILTENQTYSTSSISTSTDQLFITIDDE